jgi:hypothetical protein
LQAFSSFDQELMERLCKGMQLRHARDGTIICEEDERGESMYVVLAGGCTVRADAPPGQPTRQIERYHRGSVAASTHNGTRSVHQTVTAANRRPAAEDVPAATIENKADAASSVTRTPTRTLQSHGSDHWIQKFMASAVQHHDPEVAGRGNEMTPLAVIAAAKWRRTLADVQAAEAMRLAEEEAQKQEERACGEGIAGLLGKAAASNWKAATFGDRLHQADESKPALVDWRSLSKRMREDKAAQARLADAALTVATRMVDEHATSPSAVSESTLAEGQEVQGREERARLYNPSKQQLAALGARTPGVTSQKLRAELAHRASIDTVLAGMERLIKRQGPARRLGQHDSRRITRALNRSMLHGASNQVRAARGLSPLLVKAGNHRFSHRPMCILNCRRNCRQGH